MQGVFNSNVTTKFVQLHYFYHKIFGGTKDIVSPLSKSLGRHVPPESQSPGHCKLGITAACTLQEQLSVMTIFVVSFSSKM